MGLFWCWEAYEVVVDPQCGLRSILSPDIPLQCLGYLRQVGYSYGRVAAAVCD